SWERPIIVPVRQRREVRSIPANVTAEFSNALTPADRARVIANGEPIPWPPADRTIDEKDIRVTAGATRCLAFVPGLEVDVDGPYLNHQRCGLAQDDINHANEQRHD